MSQNIGDVCLNLTECAPVKNLKELTDWSTTCSPVCCTVPFKEKVSPGPKTLVCHDMMGGYLHDRFVQGCPTTDCYQFYQWQFVDVFVYFSHNLVTVPPVGWIYAAHRNQVPVLGTFITEWQEGADTCAQLLKSEQSYKQAADQLVDIACHLGFDGWLINIENEIEPDRVETLRQFVEYLTSSMHSCKANSLVIWYDSVISSGKLKWQNELNSANSIFFDACDGIFLNYTWKAENLKQSAELASSQNRLEDVYVGIDVFGRGMMGGGGFNTNMAIDAARVNNLSVAIFAPGWVYETQDKKNLRDNSNRFWTLLKSHCLSMKPKHLPIITSFCAGYGDRFYHFGDLVKGSPWSNLSLQQQQPDVLFNLSSHGDSMSADLCSDLAYNGGHCLRLQGKFKDGEVKFRLFNLSIPVLDDDLFVCVHSMMSCGTQLDLCLETSNGMNVLLTSSQSDMDTHINTSGVALKVVQPCAEENLPTILRNTTQLDSCWIRSCHIVPVEILTDVGDVTGLTAVCRSTGQLSVDQCEVFVGQIQVLRMQDIPDIIPVVTDLHCCLLPCSIEKTWDQSTAQGKNCHRLLLKWTYPEDCADHFTVWYITNTGASDINYTYLGSAFYCAYVISEEVRSGQYCVVPVHSSGLSLPVQCGTMVQFNA